MAPEPNSLFSIACRKLNSVVGGNVKDGASLHRWVLLKNSLRSPVLSAPVSVADEVVEDNVYRTEEEPEHHPLEHDNFMFPDPDAFHQETGAGNSESQWLDSVLQGLGDDDDDEGETDSHSTISVLPALEDDEPLSPIYSPMSSSDDLADQSSLYYASDIAIPYPIPYPPLHPPLMPSWFELEQSPDVVTQTSPPLYHDPLPYFNSDELEDLPVPDAIDDTSDDESDAPSTPFTNSTSSLSNTDPVISPRERTQPRSHPQVYIASEDSYSYPFELDPLPFSDNTVSHSSRAFHRHYHEC
ncbi:hypothetical protein NLI96_g240 [Meripilus lineatus]|uniref:Uncharacterized protein n=1 Tax=Meripilus lineatus TaxID=2056292 RepID=A0AAD5VEX0_9APHY|nr:hypothetical protein NLI96_g240 [Physisporinus lineatus]